MKIITREQWGARPATHVEHRDLGVITAAVAHYADAPAVAANLADESAMVRSIQAFHMDTRGWFDIAYHALVGMSGNVYMGRPLDVIGAHCLNFNVQSFGVCFLTNDGFNLDAGAAFVDYVHTVEFIALHRRVPTFAHSEKTSTGCPGSRIRSWLDLARSPGGPLAV